MGGRAFEEAPDFRTRVGVLPGEALVETWRKGRRGITSASVFVDCFHVMIITITGQSCLRHVLINFTKQQRRSAVPVAAASARFTLLVYDHPYPPPPFS